MQALARLPATDPSAQMYKRVDLMQELWVQTLPSSFRATLPGADILQMTKLVKLADNLINAAHASTRPTTVSTVADQAAANHFTVRRGYSHKNMPVQRAAANPSRNRFYHEKFYASPRNCSPGCKSTKTGRPVVDYDSRSPLCSLQITTNDNTANRRSAAGWVVLLSPVANFWLIRRDLLNLPCRT